MLKISVLIFVLAFNFQIANAQKKVKNFTVSHVINAPAEKVWAVVGEDYGAIANSHPKVVSSTYINGTSKAGEGAERICHFNDKGTKYLHERQVSYDPENYTFKNQVFKAGKFPINPEYTFAIYKVEPIDEQSSRLVFDFTYRTKPAFMGGLVKGKFKKLISDYAIAVDHHVRTGEAVNKSNFKSIKKEYAKYAKN